MTTITENDVEHAVLGWKNFKDHSFLTYCYRMSKPLKTPRVSTPDRKGVFGQRGETLRSWWAGSGRSLPDGRLTAPSSALRFQTTSFVAFSPH